MRISYNKLWKMLIDKNMNKRDLAEKSGVSSASIAKLSAQTLQPTFYLKYASR